MGTYFTPTDTGPFLIVVNDWDLEGRLIDKSFEGKIDSIQNTS